MDLSVSLLVLLIICILCACAFEFINGFHDTANAVATVIYTNSLEPNRAVILSGICNATGVLVGGISVAMGIINLLPIDILLDQQVSHSLSMVFAMLLTAIIWNLGTWYLGIPASSSHTLIGSILGVGLGYSLYSGGSTSAVNWSKAGDIGLSLLISPFFGFSLTIFLMFMMKLFIKDKEIFKEPAKKKSPPAYIRLLLWFTCASVSFTHGSNDGQKGVGLIMLILIAIAPTYYALDLEKNHRDMYSQVAQIQTVISSLQHTKLSVSDSADVFKISKELVQLNESFRAMGKENHFLKADRFRGRKNILVIEKASKKLLESEDLKISDSQRNTMSSCVKDLLKFTNYTPLWVVILISLSLGIGTMVGWKRIVVTIGEKIGKTHLTYAQGASAELVAASTIGVSTWLGLPVSTTHVLSSGIAGSMVASNGIKNLQRKMVTNIALAWILTLPVCISLSACLFYLFRLIAG